MIPDPAFVARVAALERLYGAVQSYLGIPTPSRSPEEVDRHWIGIINALAAVEQAAPEPSADPARAAEKMFSKMDAEDKATFNEFIFMARGYTPNEIKDARTAIREATEMLSNADPYMTPYRAWLALPAVIEARHG